MSGWCAAFVVSIAAVMACMAAGLLFGGDPLMPAEVAGGLVLAMWVAGIARDTIRAHHLGRSIGPLSRHDVVAGVRCRVFQGGRSAFVLGVVRPRIYVGAGLLAALDDDELRAVVLHEEYHRRTLAPMRASALSAWRRLVQRWSLACHAIDARLAQLECDADRFALRQGVTPRAIASALLKSDASATGMAFDAHAQARVRSLLMPGDGLPGNDRIVAYEWAPVTIAMGIVLACHVLI